MFAPADGKCKTHYVKCRACEKFVNVACKFAHNCTVYLAYGCRADATVKVKAVTDHLDSIFLKAAMRHVD